MGSNYLRGIWKWNVLEVQHKIDFFSVPIQSFAGIIYMNIYILFICIYNICNIYIYNICMYNIYMYNIYIYIYIYIFICSAKYLAIFEEIMKSLTKKIFTWNSYSCKFRSNISGVSYIRTWFFGSPHDYLNLTYLKKCTPLKAKFRQVKGLNLQSEHTLGCTFVSIIYFSV